MKTRTIVSIMLATAAVIFGTVLILTKKKKSNSCGCELAGTDECSAGADCGCDGTEEPLCETCCDADVCIDDETDCCCDSEAAAKSDSEEE